MKVREVIKERWSPRAFAGKAISTSDLRLILESASKAPSAFNEQPWRYIIGNKSDESYEKIMSALVEFNQSWAKTAPVLLVGVESKKYQRNQKPNAHSRHDLGQASAYLSLQAMELGIYSHQMAGFDADKIRELFEIPEDFEAVTVIALGYLGDVNQLPEDLQESESKRSGRKDLKEIVFGENWSEAFFKS